MMWTAITLAIVMVISTMAEAIGLCMMKSWKTLSMIWNRMRRKFSWFKNSFQNICLWIRSRIRQLSDSPDLCALLNIRVRTVALGYCRSDRLQIQSIFQVDVRPLEDLDALVEALLDREEVRLLFNRGFCQDCIRLLVTRRLLAGQDCLSTTTMLGILYEEYNCLHLHQEE